MKAKIFSKFFIMLLLFSSLSYAFAYYPGDIVKIYSISPCKYLNVEVNSYGLQFSNCTQTALQSWYCECTNGYFDLNAEILPDAPATNYEIKIEIFNPREVEEKIHTYYFAIGTPRPTPTPAITPTPQPTPEQTPVPTEETPTPTTPETPIPLPTEPTPEVKPTPIMPTPVPTATLPNNELTTCKENLQSMMEQYEKLEKEYTALLLLVLFISLLLFVLVYATFKRAEEEQEKKEKDKPNGLVPAPETKNIAVAM